MQFKTHVPDTVDELEAKNGEGQDGRHYPVRANVPVEQFVTHIFVM